MVLRASLADGRTGCLTASDAGLGVLQVYVMGGEVLAAHSDDDEVELLRCLRAAELLPGDQVESLAEACTSAGEFMDALYDVLQEDIVQELMHERFRENLFRFLGAARGIEFEAMEVGFVSNIQIGHDSKVLLDGLSLLRDSTRAIHGSRLPLLPGNASPLEPAHVRVVELCRNGITVPELLRRAGREPNRILQAVADLLECGALAWDPGSRAPEPPSADATTPTAAPVGFELPIEDEHTDDSAPIPNSALVQPASPPVEDEAYLDAFGDYDTTRGDGSFTGLRDVVDLEGVKTEEWPATDAGAAETVELPEADAAASANAVSLNFSGPRLADEDARNKLEVVNEVLEAVRAAIDLISGTGTGQGRVQLLVDGSSGTFAALFNNVELRADGRLPVELVLKNLRKRPVTEHRRLLQRASTDLIERALSLASEDLDDSLMEQVLEKVAGYQQRLGI